MNDARNILVGPRSACTWSCRQSLAAEAVMEVLEYVASEINAGRFVGHRKHAPKSVILHNCKFSMKAIRMLGLTAETRLFALRALYPSTGRVERELLPIIADLLLSDTENHLEIRPDFDRNSGPSVQAARKSAAVP